MKSSQNDEECKNYTISVRSTLFVALLPQSALLIRHKNWHMLWLRLSK